MISLSFRQTQAEMIVRAASTVLFRALARAGSPIRALADVAEQPRYGWTAKADSAPIGPKYVRITDLQDSRIEWDSVPYCRCDEPDEYYLQPNDILFARTGATTGKTHLVRDAEPAVFASYLIRVRPKPGILPEYLYSFFQCDAYWEQIAAGKEGSAQPNVNGQKLLQLVLPVPDAPIQRAVASFLDAARRRQDGRQEDLPELPPPIQEQRRIVARIEALAAKIAAAHETRNDAEAFTAAVFDSAMNDIWSKSGGWNRRNIGELVTTVEGQVDPRLPPYSSLPHINGEFIQSGTARLMRGYRTAEEDGVKSGKFHFQPGAVLYSKIRPYLRKAAEVDIEGVCSADIYAFQKIAPEVLPRFFAYSLISPGFTRYANDLSGRTRMPKLNQKQMFAFDLPYPPLPEQHRIVAYLDSLSAKAESLKSLQHQSAAELDALLPSILDRAFRGEL